MLLLSRKATESIVINDDIVVTIMEIRGSKVRVGISAPPDVRVYRKELHDKLVREGFALEFEAAASA